VVRARFSRSLAGRRRRESAGSEYVAVRSRHHYRRTPLACTSPTVHRVSHGAIACWNAQFSRRFVSTLSTDCQAVSARLGTLLAQRGFGPQALGRVCTADLAFRCQAARSIYLWTKACPRLPVLLGGLRLDRWIMRPADLDRLRVGSSPGAWCRTSSCDSSTLWFRRSVPPVLSPVLSGFRW
jgi:hypothetical protein